MLAIYRLGANGRSWPAFLQLKGIAGQYSNRCRVSEMDAGLVVSTQLYSTQSRKGELSAQREGG
jgi:hypothetical protein